MSTYEEQESLVKALVNINSVTGSDGGEARLADFICRWLSDEQNIPGGLLEIHRISAGDKDRESLLAYLEAPEETAETLLLLGHTDTVAIEDFGALKPFALCPDQLEEAYLKEISAGTVTDDRFIYDIKSGEYMLGRGALDMKSGVAANLRTLQYFATHRDEQKFNLMLLCECDEEGDSKGMLSSVKFIEKLCAEKQIKIPYAICADFSEEPAVYLGTIGKFLPCFVAFGKEAHVGDALESVDPNLIISNVICNIDYNMDYADRNLGVCTPPPVSLKQTDTKESYSVQTAGCAYTYFNWFTLKRSPEEVLELCLEEGRKALAQSLKRLPNKYKERVYTLKEYAESLGTSIKKLGPADDLRLFLIEEAKRLRSLDRDKDPVLLVLLSGLSYDPITVDPESKMGQAAKTLGIPAKIYYPYISDTSFVKLLGDVQAVNLGSYGFSGHTPMERVNKEYTFETLPKLQIKLIKELGK